MGVADILASLGCEEDMTVTPSTLAQMSHDDLNALHEAITEGLIMLKQQSEAFGGKARILMFALAIRLDEVEILDHLVGLAILAEDPAQTKPVASHAESPTSIVH
jgi:hypothetical protein